ncbi:MAG TPA: tetratricopeptide repeat protein [Bacteroidota bacterium]|nr:tetratricopeptide repeat protein [Bacteroidota bacterium]
MPKKQILRGFSLGFFIILGLLFQSCSGQKEAAPPQVSSENRELALQYFLAGSMADQKGDHAKAVLEYQDALKYKQDPAIYHAISKDYSILGKHDLAIQNAKEAIRLEEDNVRYRQALAEIYLHASNLDGAVGQYEQIVRLDSTDRTTQMNLARLYQIHSPSKAIAMYETILKRFGPEADALAQLAQLYANAGEHTRAIRALSELSELEPTNLEVRKALGDVYLRQDSVDAALRVFRELAELRPDDLEVRAAVAHSYLLKQDYAMAAAEFESVFKGGDSLSADDQIRFAQVFVSFVQKDSAVAPYAEKLFHTIRERFPEDWRAYLFLGALANTTGDDSAALGYFGKVKALAAWNPDGWIGVASVYYDAGNFAGAINVLTEAKKFIPEEFRLYFLLGIACQRGGQRVEAASALERAVQINPKSVDALSALALVYDELGQAAESDSIYERALRIDPENPLLLNNYSYSLAERGIQLDRALKMAEEAVKAQPENQSFLDTYGWIYYQMGKYSEAREYINKAIVLGSTSAVIHEHLGDIYDKLSDAARAMEYWKKALEYDPANAGLAEKIRRGSL